MDTEKLQLSSHPYGTGYVTNGGDSGEKSNTDENTTFGKCLVKYGCYGILIILLVISPVSMITIGSLYFFECPYQHYIPVFLVVAGCLTVLSGITTVVTRRRIKKVNCMGEGENANGSREYLAITNLINCITLSWYIAGFVWVYSATPLPTNQICHPVLYFFSLWLCNTLLSMFILFIIASIVALLLGNDNAN